jgi:hypothetical protein
MMQSGCNHIAKILFAQGIIMVKSSEAAFFAQGH